MYASRLYLCMFEREIRKDHICNRMETVTELMGSIDVKDVWEWIACMSYEYINGFNRYNRFCLTILHIIFLFFVLPTDCMLYSVIISR